MSELVEQLSPLEAAERADEDNAFREVFNTAAGKRVLFWMLEQCAIYRDPDCGESTHLTSGVMGEQRIGRKLIAKLDAIDPRNYPALLLAVAEDKAMKRAASERAAQSKEQDDDDAA